MTPTDVGGLAALAARPPGSRRAGRRTRSTRHMTSLSMTPSISVATGMVPREMVLWTGSITWFDKPKQTLIM